MIRVLRWLGFCAALAGLTLLSASLRGPALTAPVWPVSAVVLTFALRETSKPAGRAAILALSYAVLMLIGVANGRPVAMALGLPIAIVLETLVGLVVLRGFEQPVLGARGFVRLAGVSLLGPLVSTTAAATVFAAARGRADVAEFALRWFAAHALGMMVTAPVLLSLGPETMSRARALRIGLTQAAVLAVNLFAFTQVNPASLFLIAPLMAVAVFMGGEAAAAITLALSGLSALLLTAVGFGPEPGSAYIYVYQTYLACLAVGAHALVALVRQLDGYSLELGEPRRSDAWRGSAK